MIIVVNESDMDAAERTLLAYDRWRAAAEPDRTKQLAALAGDLAEHVTTLKDALWAAQSRLRRSCELVDNLEQRLRAAERATGLRREVSG